MEKEKKGPEKKFVAGAISLAVWNNVREKDGEKIEFHTISIERSYKDKEDKWRTSGSFGVGDLPKVEALARKAYEFLMIKEGNRPIFKEEEEVLE